MNIKFNLDKKNSNTIAIRNSYNQSQNIPNWKRAIITWVGIFSNNYYFSPYNWYMDNIPSSIYKYTYYYINICPLMTFIVTHQLEKFLKKRLIWFNH